MKRQGSPFRHASLELRVPRLDELRLSRAFTSEDEIARDAMRR
jgi:hypothetical protein